MTIRAIICDDEPAAQNIIRHFVDAQHIPVEIVGCAKDGQAAVKLAHDTNPDLVFMDIQMPHMNGLEAIQQIRDSKTIIITAYDSFEYAQKALRLGVCDIILKPIDFDQLQQAIERAIGWRFTGNAIVDTTLSWLYKHYNEKIELKTLAELTYCTESHLARVFKKEMGTSILAFAHNLRISRSAMLMEQSDLSVKEISEQVGYHNLNQFYKYFQLYMDTTPAAYAKQVRKQTAGETQEV
ncbi:MAG: response regulator [Eggerthellaceae bacterium]|nr:response regulator [Eggerthellaceae bacterium]